ESWYRAHPDVHSPDRGSADRIEKSIAMLRRLSPRSVIDLGCGTGTVAAQIRDHCGAEPLCFDISANAVAECRERGLDAHVLNIDEEPFPVRDSTIDAVLMAEVIEHVVNPDRALTEVHRVL